MMKHTALALTLGVAFTTLVFAEDNWPQFRGPDGMGHSNATGLPVTWSETQNIKWKTAIHDKGWSSPVIWGNQIWMTTATEDGKQLFVICVDRNTGKILRDIKLFDVETPQYIIKLNSPASPTPVIEEGRVYVTFGSPGTACLDTLTGKVLWQRRDLECNHFRGAGSSPILFGNLFILNFDGSDFQYVVALDKNTGKTVWKTKRSVDFKDLDKDGKPNREGDMRKGFCTPLVASFGGAPPILIDPGSKAFYAYDPLTGKEIWRTEEHKNHSVAVRPSVANGLIYAATGMGKASVWAIRPGGHGVVTDTHVVWKAPRNVPTMPSPIVVGDLLFMVSDNGIITCLDAKNGQVVWEQKIGGEFSASPISAEGRIYFFDREGKITVIQAGREFKQLAANQLDEGFMASPAVSGKALFLRTKTHLYRVER
ncbi:MAG: PQQ-binding-like beta-propeller repeat protein [Verrucomicrobia bacterium]|nr:PQQ-binding-like beta-propeller repeat protein [Verrucomicrobiota bacterium]